MIHRQPTLEQLEQALRSGVCARCAFRSACIAGQGLHRACEEECPLFLNLPALAQRAGRLDPMVGRYEQVLCEGMRKIIEESDEAVGEPLRRCHRQAAKILARLLHV